jgi:hypothetical protein
VTYYVMPRLSVNLDHLVNKSEGFGWNHARAPTQDVKGGADQKTIGCDGGWEGVSGDVCKVR